MRKEDCEWIKNNLITIQASLPREPRFQITFADMLRLYGDYGTRQELERCLRDLEKEGVLRKKKASDTYVFVNEIGRKLSDLNIEDQKVIEDKDQVGKELDGINKLQDFWLDYLPPEPNSSPQPGVLKYFVSVYWQSKLTQVRQKLIGIEAKSGRIRREVYDLKKALDDL